MKPYIASHLKEMNRKVIYQLMEQKEVLSRTDISRLTGISAPTVLKITSFMVEKGILLDYGEGNTALGRKPMLLGFNPNAAYIIVVDYHVGYVELGIIDLKGTTKCTKKEKTDSYFLEHFERNLGKCIHEIIGVSGIDRSKILGVGIAIPGAVDSQHNHINFAPLIGIHEKVDIAPHVKRLGEEMKLPVFIENDVNAAAVGEFFARQPNMNDDMVYITVGNGVGAGIIINGKLYKGARCSAGEVGYMVFDRGFSTSKKQGGWLEEQINNHLLRSPLGIAETDDFSHIDPAELEKVTDQVASYIALCIANISYVLDIWKFVLGGELTEKLGGIFFEMLNVYVSKLCIHEIVIERRLCLKPNFTGMTSIVRSYLLDLILTE